MTESLRMRHSIEPATVALAFRVAAPDAMAQGAGPCTTGCIPQHVSMIGFGFSVVQRCALKTVRICARCANSVGRNATASYISLRPNAAAGLRWFTAVAGWIGMLRDRSG